MSTETPRTDAWQDSDWLECSKLKQPDYMRSMAAYTHCRELERENTRLREELTTRERLYKEQWQRAEQAEARALEYKTEHAALLGTSQWQETEIADLRDDVKRLMQTVSECEERALANEKAHQRSHAEVMRLAEELRKYQPGSPMILNATTGAKHEAT